MRTSVRAGAAIGALLALAAVGGPVSAAGPYTITAGSSTTLSAGGNAFTIQGCNASFLSSPLNGVDARVVDISGWAGRQLTFSWSATANAGMLNVRFLTAGCGGTFDPANGDTHMRVPGNRVFNIPAGTKWLLVTSEGNAQVSFHVN